MGNVTENNKLKKCSQKTWKNEKANSSAIPRTAHLAGFVLRLRGGLVELLEGGPFRWRLDPLVCLQWFIAVVTVAVVNIGVINSV